jgi:hypothetical protein
MKLRQGRKVGRTIYAQLGDQPSDDDPLVGVMDTAELARQVVGTAEVFPIPERPAFAVIRPGDRLVVSFADRLSPDNVQRARDFVRERIPEVSDVVVLSGITGLAVVRPRWRLRFPPWRRS